MHQLNKGSKRIQRQLKDESDMKVKAEEHFLKHKIYVSSHTCSLGLLTHAYTCVKKVYSKSSVINLIL